jgi:penicillin G amidase
MGSRTAVSTLAAVVALALPALAQARVINAETVLPPGQSGFVPPADQPPNPHITDQLQLFEDFSFKPAGFDQPAASTDTPRAGVTITRDAFGVPSVRAGTEDDAWFGAGYAVAQDRLVELELFRRSAEGTLAAVLGEGRLQSDIVARRDYYTKAELRKMLGKVPKTLRARFDSYADGVNAWLARVASDPTVKPQELALLGLVPAKWTAVDSAAIGVQLARTVPSDDGHELQNWRALRSLGAKRFAKLLPLRQTGEPTTVPAASGRFPSQPGRSKRDEKRGFKQSRRFLGKLKPPKAQAAVAHLAGRLPARGGSSHWAFRGPGNQAFLFTGPQLGYSVPELFVELEVHAPGLDVRGVTAPGIPVIAAGHNGHIAWGITSGLDDDDDLYVERLKGKSRYRFKGKTRKLDCRTEKFAVSGKKAVTRKFCRTVHGPVQETSKGRAYARRYAIWKRELGTLRGLSELNSAGSVAAAGKAIAHVTWNENTLVADDAGHIGWWHPGRLPLRPRKWDERLPYPGTGEAEWRGVLKLKQLPKVVDPKQGWISNWNNQPSAAWTNGDMNAPEENAGPLNRGAFLERLVAAAAASPSYEALKNVDRVAGTTSQQRPLMDAKLRAAQAAASGPGRTVLDAIVNWDGNYDRTDANGTVDPGVAAFDALKDAAEATLPRAVIVWLGQRGGSHPYDVGGAEAVALNAAGAKGLASIAADAAARLQAQFGSADPAAWRTPRKLYDVQVQGVAPKPTLKFYDRGTWQQAAELGP